MRPSPLRFSAAAALAATLLALGSPALASTAGHRASAPRTVTTLSQSKVPYPFGSSSVWRTSVARAEVRSLPPAQRAQANTRQLRLGELRDANRSNPEGLRTWLRRAGEEILLLRSQQAIADRVQAADQARTATRAAAEANGSAAASSAATST